MIYTHRMFCFYRMPPSKKQIGEKMECPDFEVSHMASMSGWTVARVNDICLIEGEMCCFISSCRNTGGWEIKEQR